MFIKGKDKFDIFIEVCIVLLAMYFMHLSQFILPIMCLAFFIKNRLRLNVKNWPVFIVLCLFGITFFIFSYKLGFYSVMGLCLPMDYYVGQNVLNNTSISFKETVYLVALGMCIHVMLNFGYDLIMYGSSIVIHRSHYDIWTGDIIKTTTTAVNYVIPTSCMYYIILREDNKKFKYCFIVIYMLMMIYNIFLGRRTPLLMFVLVFGAGLLINAYEKKSYKLLLGVATTVLVCALIIAVLVLTNFKGFGDRFFMLHIVSKFVEFGLDGGRLDIFLDALKYMPEYPWGGQYISGLLEIQIHDLWTDIYDFAGVVPYVLIIVYFILNFVLMFRLIRDKGISKEIKVLSAFVFVCCMIEMFLEPVMTGSSLFLICFVLIFAALDSCYRKVGLDV